MELPVAYTVFHLNLAFSSIEEEERQIVIDRCYWPLLKLAQDGFPIGIEATSHTLLEIDKREPNWTAALRRLISEGSVEFIGSGYTQMIAPLVPAEVTEANLMLGMSDYQETLGVRPQIALINEQAYSPGILPLYKAAGFEAVMMDWSEPSSHNNNWSKSYAHRPQTITGANGSQMPVIWSDAMSFQKFQRYAHSEIGADEYFEFLGLQLEQGAQAFPLYTSDAEVFDYRPGRFGSEAGIGAVSEYERIALLLKAFQGTDAVKLGTPRDALAFLADDATPIQLETAQAPIPVKKQRKYNILRWAVTGRADLTLNTNCWRLYESMLAAGELKTGQWRTLCELWASDYRTHITEKRWSVLIGTLEKNFPSSSGLAAANTKYASHLPADVKVERVGRFLVVETPQFHLALNCGRGLSIQSFGPGTYIPAQAGAPAKNGFIGTLAHGFFDDIEFGADFYSGHFVGEPATSPKITDLTKCEPVISFVPETGLVHITADIETTLGMIQKTIEFELNSHRITVSYQGISFPLANGTFRCGHITLNPQAFDPESLYFQAKNGGHTPDWHALWDRTTVISLDHGAPVSRLVSASTGLGLTDGVLEFGDAANYIKLSMDRIDAAGIGLITAKPVSDSFFVRAAITLGESDETVRSLETEVTTSLPDPKIRYSIEFGEQPKQL